MRPRRVVPPPERISWADGYRFVLGILMIPLGITIFVRSALAGVYSAPMFLISLLLVAFGIYRVYVGIVRYRIYRSLVKKGPWR